MTESIYSSSAMQTDHLHWKSQNSLWRDDVKQWEKEYEIALAELEGLERMIRQHGEVLKAHAGSINAHEAALNLHQRGMADLDLQGKGADEGQPFVKPHEQQAIKHLNLNGAHEQLKKRHHTLIAQLSLIKSAFGKSTDTAPIGSCLL